MSSSETTLNVQLQHLINLAKRRYCVQFSLRASSFVLATIGVVWLFSGAWLAALGSGLLLSMLAVYVLVNHSHLQHIHRENFLLHLNQQFPSLQHSAQLLNDQLNSKTNHKQSQGSLLQRLQTERVESALKQLISDKGPKLAPQYPLRSAGIANLIVVAVIATLLYLDPLTWLTHQSATTNKPVPPAGQSALQIMDVQVQVVPPAYSGIATTQQRSLDIETLAGSQVTWDIKFSDPQRQYAVQLASGLTQQFEKQGERFVLTMPVERSGIYRLTSEQHNIGSVHSIAATNDQLPKIRIVTPKSTITTFAKTDTPRPTLEAQISDDFGIAKVDILASVAKGSGEAVKFRDEIFEFDNVTSTQTGTNTLSTYTKQWDFAALDMEPGDELYFTVRVWDNRQPDGQMSRSITKILRWLDDEEAVAMSDGILIDFMPEYFKSQRQIIIETKQLIADRAILSEQEFDATSRSLGHSQSDLKLKYGQYLGDEFDDGSGNRQMEDDHGSPHVDVKDGDHNDEEEHDDTAQLAAGKINEPAHEHHQEQDHQETDKSGYQQVIEEFGHNHGDTDIGVMGTLSPKALMKQAIAYMWDAELQLLLSKPELALPHEENALKYLNRARKAERIYVKRLGFEPPPVSESRRYQGDLSDILSYQQYRSSGDENTPADDIKALLQLLNIAQQETALQTSISDALNLRIDRIKQRFIEQAQTRPAMVQHVATLEKMQLAKQVWLSDCQSCMTTLFAELWRQLPETISPPSRPTGSWSRENPMLKAYSEYLLQEQGGQR